MGAFDDIMGSGLIGPALGIALEGHNDRRQLNQQQKLQDMQMKGNMAMGEFNYQKQLDMWKATSYPGQMEQMKKAGINPGLMYGIGGGGGVTTGSPGGQVTGANAQGQSGEILGATGMAMQMKAQRELLEAQKENIQADTQNKIASAENTNADTPNKDKQGHVLDATAENITQDTLNKKAQESLTKASTEIAKLEQELRTDTMEYSKGIIQETWQKISQEVNIIRNQSDISGATKEDAINKIRAEAVGAIFNNALTKAKTAEARSNIAVNSQQINESKQRVINLISDKGIQWEKLNQGERMTKVAEAMKDWNTDAGRWAAEQVLGVIRHTSTGSRTVSNYSTGESATHTTTPR